MVWAEAVYLNENALHSPHRYGEKRKGSESAKELSGVALLSATMNQCKKANQQLLIPITVWIGMEQAFIGADFTQVINLSPFYLLLRYTLCS